MSKIKHLVSVLSVTVVVGGITLYGINHGNFISHVGQRNVEEEHLTSHEVLEIVYNYLKITKNDVSELNIELNHDDNQYELSFDVNDSSYYFEVHSTTGIILKLNQE